MHARNDIFKIVTKDGNTVTCLHFLDVQVQELDWIVSPPLYIMWNYSGQIDTLLCNLTVSLENKDNAANFVKTGITIKDDGKISKVCNERRPYRFTPIEAGVVTEFFIEFVPMRRFFEDSPLCIFNLRFSNGLSPERVGNRCLFPAFLGGNPTVLPFLYTITVMVLAK